MDQFIDNSRELNDLENHRLRNEIIVMTNGCFDLLHPGHLRYLQQAKNLGNVLVVAINSDQSVRRLKGNDRPINSQDFRKEMLLGLKSVDYVCIFDEDNILKLLPQVRPNVLVKGGDWTVENIIGHDYMEKTGGQTYSLPFVTGLSSTDIVNKIKMLR